MTEQNRPMNPEAARIYFNGVGELARSEPNRDQRRTFFAEIKQDPEYQAARDALRPQVMDRASTTIDPTTVFNAKEPRNGKPVCVKFGDKRPLIEAAAAKVGMKHSEFMRHAMAAGIAEIAEKAGGMEKLTDWYNDILDARKKLLGDKTNE